MTATPLHRVADLSRRKHALTGRHLVLLPPPRTPDEIDAGLPPRAVTLAEEILDDAAILPEDRDLLLCLLGASVHEQPGPYVEHLVETWRLWYEIEPDSREEDEKKERAWGQVQIAIRELVTR